MTTVNLAQQKIVVLSPKQEVVVQGAIGPEGPQGPIGPEGAGMPVGTIIDFAGGTIPSNFLECDGGTFVSATYPELAAQLGTIWGAAPAGETRLPDLRDRSTIGASGTNSAGSTLGSATVSVPQHNHTASFTGAAMANHGHADTFTLPDHVHPHSHTHSVDPPSTSVSGGFGTQGNPSGWTVGATGVIFGPSGGNSGSPSGWFQQALSVNIASFTSGGASVTNTSNPTTNPAISGSVTAASAGTPSGTVTVNNTGTVNPTNYHPVAAIRKLIRAA